MWLSNLLSSPTLNISGFPLVFNQRGDMGKGKPQAKLIYHLIGSADKNLISSFSGKFYGKRSDDRRKLKKEVKVATDTDQTNLTIKAMETGNYT